MYVVSGDVVGLIYRGDSAAEAVQAFLRYVDQDDTVTMRRTITKEMEKGERV